MPIGRKPRESVGRKQKLFEREAEVKDRTRIQSWSEEQMKGIMTNLGVTKQEATDEEPERSAQRRGSALLIRTRFLADKKK